MGILQGYTIEQLVQLIADCDEAVERLERLEREAALRRHILHDLQRERARYIVELRNRS